MANKIIWTRQATSELQTIVTYLRGNWSKPVAEEFINTIYTKIRLLEDMPETGVASYEYANVRRLLIARNSVLYYLVENEAIIILNVIDIDPESGDYELEE